MLASAGPAVGKSKVVLPLAAVGGFLPGAGDGVPVRAEGAGKTLPEVQRREVLTGSRSEVPTAVAGRTHRRPAFHGSWV